MAAPHTRARSRIARRWRRTSALLLVLAAAAPLGADEAPPRLDVPVGMIECGGEPIAVAARADGSVAIDLASGERCVAALRDGEWGIVGREAAAIARDGLGPLERTAPPARGEGFEVLLEPDRHRFIIRRDGVERAVGDFGARPGLLARPRGLALHDGRIHIADTGNHRVQVFTSEGVYIHAAGLHQLAPREGAGRLHYPTAVAVAADGGSLFVAEPLEGRVQVFRARRAGDPPPDPALAWERADLPAHYGEHWALSGNWLLVAEPDAERVSLYDASGDGDPAQVADLGGIPGGRLGELRDPGAVHFLPGAGVPRAVVLDRGNRRLQVIEVVPLPGPVRSFDPRRLRVVSALRLEEGLEVEGLDAAIRELAVDPAGALWGSADGIAFPIEEGARSARAIPLGPGESLRFAGGRAVILDRVRGAIRVGRDPAALRGAGAGILLPPGSRPESVASLADGTLVLADGVGHRLLLVGADGGVATIGSPGIGAVEFHHPRAVVVDPEDRIWVLDHGNHRGQVIDREGNLLRAFGSRSYVEPIRRGRAAAVDAAGGGSR